MTGQREKNEIAITVRAVEGAVRIEVKDTGAGIPSDVLPHIFDPFFTTREDAGGTGLGLSLSRQIAAQHGGTLTVESEVGVGSTFCLEIPVAADQAVSGSQTTPPGPGGR